MTGRHQHSVAVLALVSSVILTGLLASAAPAQDKAQRVPVVMEEATVRGRVVVLETRRTDRHAPEGLDVQVWSRADEKKGVEKKLLHETKTDEDGLFALPLLAVQEYELVVGEVKLRLIVVPRSEERKDQEEPKILLILLPKESVT